MKKIVLIPLIFIICLLNSCINISSNNKEDYIYVDYDVKEITYETWDGKWTEENVHEMIDYYYYNEIEDVDVYIKMIFVSHGDFTIAELIGKMGISNITNSGFSFQVFSTSLIPKLEGYSKGEYEIKLLAKNVCFYGEYNNFKKIDRGHVKLSLQLDLKYYR